MRCNMDSMGSCPAPPLHSPYAARTACCGNAATARTPARKAPSLHFRPLEPCPPALPLQEKKAEDEALDAKKRKRLERDPLHQGLIVARANLKARDYQIDLASKLNKTQARAAPARPPAPGRLNSLAAKLARRQQAGRVRRWCAQDTACRFGGNKHTPQRSALLPSPPASRSAPAGGVGDHASGAAGGLLLQRV